MMRNYDQALQVGNKGTALLNHRARARLKARRGSCRAVAAPVRHLGRALCVILIISLLVSSTPAATQTMVGIAKEWQVSLAFWLRANGLPARFFRTLTGENGPRLQEKQRDRDARVSQIKIYPGDLTLRVDERVWLAAIAYDSNGSPVGGVKFRWSAHDELRNRVARVSRLGDFEGLVPGLFKVTAESAGRTAQVNITVLDVAVRRKKNDTPLSNSPVSTRDLPPVGISRTQGPPAQRYSALASRSGSASLAWSPGGKQSRRGAKLAGPVRRLRSHATKKSNESNRPSTSPMPLLPGDGWDNTNYWSADDPGNGVGNPAGGTLDGGAGSGNFQFAAPLVSLPGRGIDISLGLAYNSRLWNKAGTQITFDVDRGWPAPGFSLGFGKLFGMGGGSMLIDADGTRHPFTGNLTTYSWGQYFVGHTTDGSLIDYWHWTNSVGWIISGQAKLPNGTVIDYGAHGPGGVFPTRITDPNGNFVTVTYVNNAGPEIQTVTDTLGRVINFYYDTNNLLTAVTAPGLNNGPERAVVRLHYKQQPLNYSFSGLTPVVRDSNPWVIDAIYYPGIGTGYWLGDSDSYSTYGMLAKVVEQRAMGFSASSLNEQGTVTQGEFTQQEAYNYPLFPGDTGGTSSSNLTDAPTYTSMSESWTRDGTPNNNDSATTNYEVQDSSPRIVSITLPNGTKSTQYSYNHPGQFDDGLLYYDETRNSAGTLLQSSTSMWAPGGYDSPRPTRVESTNELSQTTATEFSYGSVYNQVTEVRNYDYAAALLHSTITQYENSTNYINRHIFNLPLSVEIHDGDNNRLSRSDYQYDGQVLTQSPNVVQHDQASNPYADAEGFCYTEPDWSDPDCTGDCSPETPCNGYCTQIYYCPYVAATDYRGNVTQVTSYADAVNLTGAVTESRRYDVTGNMVTASTSCCQQTSLSYTLDTQYAYPLSQTRGSATDGYAQVTTSATYDFNTALTLSGTDANGSASQTTYNADNLRPQTLTVPTGAHTDYVYDDIAMTVTQSTYLSGHPADTGLADQNMKYLNGRGQVRQEKALGAGGVWDFVDTVYDNMGRVSQQSRPYRSGDTQQWSANSYDALSRVVSVTGPDGSTTGSFYNEASRPNVAGNSPGETMRLRDAWGRERWGRTDAEGRLVEVVEPNPSGDGSVATGGLLTTYSYNTLGNLIGVSQGAQTRAFKYDSLGRLTAQKLAEASGTLNDAGTYVGGGTWSDVFTYDGRSNLTSRTDARGVKTVYTYNGDPLNRLQSVSWDTSGFGDTANPILSAAAVTYQYRSKDSPSQLRDVTQLSSVTTSGISGESYSFDSEGRVSSKTLTISGRPSYPFVTDYSYDLLDRITDVRYPAEYGNGTQPRKLLHHDYDIASRLSNFTVDGQTQASQFVYNAASQTTSLVVGAGGANPVTENYGYNAQTGLLDNQTVVRSGNTLLNLSYDYAGANGKRTGQLTRVLNNLNHNKDRGYTYDALGRLTQATGGASGSLWTQTYSYDRYGNRTSVSASGYSASLHQRGGSPTVREGSASIGSPSEPKIELPTDQLATKSEIALPAPLRPDAPRLNSDFRSHHTSRSARPKPATPQGGGPVFTDDPLVPGVTAIKAVHVTELRDAVNQARTRGGLATTTWAEAVAPGVLIKAAHILELRTRLDEARAALGLSAASYTDPGLSAGTTVKAVHIQELRQRVTEALTVNIPIPVDGLANLSFDAATNRITTAGFAYDAAGNQVRALAASGSQRFQYDAANRLVKVKADDNVTVLAGYTYGDSNERLIGEEGGVRTYYACDGSAEYTESGSSTAPQWSKTYIYLGARLLSTLTPNGSGGEGIQYHHPDRLGTRLVTDPSNGTSFEQVSLPFGTALKAESTGPTTRRFTSYDRSLTTGLDYAVNRHYDPRQGRFTQVDPIGMSAASLLNPQSLNTYSYVGNDPVNRTDAAGLFWGKLWRGILKVLSNKWVQLAITVAILVIAHYYPGSIFGFGGGASSSAARTAVAPVLKTAAQVAARQAAISAGLIAAAPLEGIIAGGGAIAADITSLALAGALGTGLASKAQLTKQQREDYKRAKSDADKNLHSAPCAEFLASKLVVSDVTTALARQRPFNGLLSTITALKAGVAKPGYLIAQDSIRYLFRETGAIAMTGAYSGATRYDVYLRLSRYDSVILIHEALHSATRLGDIDLAFKLTGHLYGAQQGSQASAAITDALKSHGCGG